MKQYSYNQTCTTGVLDLLKAGKSITRLKKEQA